MMKLFKWMAKSLAAVAFLAVATAANAVSTAGGVQTFSWSYNTGAGVTITGNGSFTANLSGGNLVLDVSLSNTTALPAGTNMALMSFGFGIDPNASSVTITNTTGLIVFDSATMSTGGNTNIPSLTGIEVCAYGGNNCTGGSVNDGLQAGQTDAFKLTLAPLAGGAWGASVTIAPIGFKFQGTVGSFEFYSSSSSSSSTSTSTGTVSEPGTSAIALLGLGLLGAALRSRRRAKQG